MSQWLVAPVCMAPAGGPTAVDADLIGTWKLAGGEIEFQDTGERRPLYGADRLGYIIFTPEGRMMGMIEGDGRKAPQTDEDRVRLFRTMFAYSGQYRLEGDKWITAVDIAWSPAWIGTDQVRLYKVEGDPLVVSTPWAIEHQDEPGGASRRTLSCALRRCEDLSDRKTRSEFPHASGHDSR